MENRPKKDDLVEHNIMKGTNVAPNLQAATDSLIREKLSNALEHKIEQRPKKDELIEHNIMKGKKKRSI